MKIDVNRLAMLEATKNVAKVAPTNSPVEALNGVLVECNDDTGEVYLTATNCEVSVQQKVMASVGESGAMLVNSRMLVGMMSLLESEFVTLTAEKPEVLTVNGGRCVYTINCLPSKSYPKPTMPFPEESVIMKGICSLVKRTTFAVSRDESKPALQCVNIKIKNNSVHAAASDGIRMMLVKDSAEPTDEQEFLLPGRSLQMLASVSSDSDVFEVSDLGNEVVFVRGDMMFVIRKMVTGDFIDTTAVVRYVKPAYSAVADAGKLREALDLISIGALVGDTRVPINLVLSNGEIILTCNSEYSEANITIPANVLKDTPDTGFFYDVSALTKLFQVVGGKVKLELDARGFMLIRTRNEVYFQAPVQPRAKKSIPAKGGKGEKETKSAKGARGEKEVA